MSRDHIVTDHALVRYLERVNGVNIKALKDSMITNEHRRIILRGEHITIVTNGVKLVCNNGNVITVIDV